jgi:hypothetical protein
LGFQNLPINKVQDKIKDQVKLLKNLTQSKPQNISQEEKNEKVTQSTQNAHQLHMRFSLFRQQGFDAQIFLKLIEDFSLEGRNALQFIEDPNIRSQIISKLSFIIKTTYALVGIYNNNNCAETQQTTSLKVKILNFF